MTCYTLWLGRAYEFVRVYFLATGVLSDSRWQTCTRWLCFFYRTSMVGPPRPRFCCLQYSIISYVRSRRTTACCRRVVLLLLHTIPYEMLRFLLAALLLVSLRSSCYYCCSCTTAQMLPLLFLSSVFSHIIKLIPDPRKIHCGGK